MGWISRMRLRARPHVTGRGRQTLGLAALAALLPLLLVLVQACGRLNPAESAKSLASTSEETEPPLPPDEPPPPIAKLPPCTSDEFSVDFLRALAALPAETQTEQREQLRDWLWTATLGHLAKGSSVEDMFSGVADQPLLRDESMAHVLRLPTGSTRATTTKTGDVIVLVEASADDQLEARVLDAIDEQALALGRTPTRARVYGFELQPSLALAKICEIAQLDAKALESSERGFRRASVSSVAQLDQFLADGVDLLGASCSATGLELTGRTRARNAAAQFSSEHVASIAQRLNARYVPTSHFGTSVAMIEPAQREQIRLIVASLHSLLAQGSSTRLRLDLLLSQDPNARFYSRLLAFRDANPNVALDELVLSAQLQETFDGRPGFSLDPKHSVAKLLSRLDELLAALPDPKALERTLVKWGSGEYEARILAASKPLLEEARDALVQGRPQLKGATDDGLESAVFRLSEQLAKQAPHAANLLHEAMGSSAKQCARYDGPLAGTEAGMTFFYTDVSAKFFARDFGRKSPEGVVPGFQSVVNYANSTASCEGPSRPGTRIWFGLRDEGYKRESDGALRFSPTTTRLFAKGSVPGSGEAETEPNPSYRRFIRWWDANYRAMSDWDPQYETLNQLMKWSVVAQQMRLTQRDTCLGFLKDAQVRRDHRLARWVAARPGLRWHDALQQVEAASSGIECLPLIRSDAFITCGGSGSLKGGVSAGSLEEVTRKPVRSSRKTPWLEQVAADKAPTSVTSDRVRFDRLSRSGGGELTDVELSGRGAKLTFKANVDAKAGQIGRDSLNSAHSPLHRFEKSIQQTQNTLQVTQRDNDLLRGGLKATDLGETVLLEIAPGSLQRSKAFAQRIVGKMSQDGGNVLSAAHGLAGKQEVFDLGSGQIAVRFVDGKAEGTYAIMSSGVGERGPPADLVFFVGTREGGRVADGARARYESPLQVRILNAARGEKFVTERGGRRLPALESKAEVLKDRVEQATIKGDFAQAEVAFKAAGSKLDADMLSDIAGSVQQAQVLAARSGHAESADKLALSIAIERRKRGAPGADDAATVLGQATRVLAPASFPPSAKVPPAIFPRGAPPKPENSFVARLVEMPLAVGGGRTFASTNGELFRISRLTPAARAAGERVGSAFRLTSPSRLAAVIVPCDDGGHDDRPRCTESAPEMEVLISKAMVATVCPAANLDTTCRSEAYRCDTDKDGALMTDAEQACLRKVRLKFDTQASPDVE